MKTCSNVREETIVGRALVEENGTGFLYTLVKKMGEKGSDLEMFYPRLGRRMKPENRVSFHGNEQSFSVDSSMMTKR